MKKLKLNSAIINEDIDNKTIDDDIITDEEVVLKNDLIKILKDDGKGHHHALYAKVLKMFPVKIVPFKHPIKTAAIDPKEKVIYFNRGFFSNKQTFYQLAVITRHELLHFLLDHQIRMIAELKNRIPEAHLSLSKSIHSMYNTLQDFEISERYTDDDKEVVRNTWINGKLIHGLIVEEHRPEWNKMSVEAMSAALEKEIAELNNTGELANKKSGNLQKDAAEITAYKRASDVSDFNSVKEFRKYTLNAIKKGHGPDAKIFDAWKSIFDEMPDKIKDLSQSELDSLITEIKDSKPMDNVKLMSPKDNSHIITLYTPEEKTFGIEIIAIIKNKFNYDSDYEAWYKEIIRKLKEGKFTEDQVKDMLDAIA